jgi:ferredoxin
MRARDEDDLQYKVTINKKRCLDCGLAAGRCPPHARVLARIIGQHCIQDNCPDIQAGIFPEQLYDEMKRAEEACPMKAITITKLDEG